MTFGRMQDVHSRNQRFPSTFPSHRPCEASHQQGLNRPFASIDAHAASARASFHGQAQHIQNQAAPAPIHHNVMYNDDLPRQLSDVRRSQQLQKVREAARNRTCSQGSTVHHQSIPVQQGQHLTHQHEISRKSDLARAPELDGKTPKSAGSNGARFRSASHAGPSAAGLSAADRPRSLLSRDEAAVLIQAAWRGHQVRATKPLEVGKTILELRKLARDMEERLGDKEFVAKVVSDPREKVRATETIMCWLLRLDEVQSPNQEVRNLRRDMARRLNKLLDEVESLGAVKEAASNTNDTRSVTSGDAAPGSFMLLSRRHVKDADTASGLSMESHVRSGDTAYDTASANTFQDLGQSQGASHSATDRDIAGAVSALSPDSSIKAGGFKRKSIGNSTGAGGGGKAERGAGDEERRSPNPKRRRRRAWRDVLWRWRESLGGLCGGREKSR